MSAPLSRREEKALASNLDHENLDVYRVSMEFIDYVAPILKQLAPEFAYMADQLRRAASSISQNVAEGTGRVGHSDKARFYGYAKGSAAECGAALDILLKFGCITTSEHLTGKVFAKRLVSMLVKLAQSADERR